MTRHCFWFGLILSLVAFPLHFAWELGQCRLFFVHTGLPPSYRDMIVAAMGDILITLAIFGLCAARQRSWNWISAPLRTWPWLFFSWFSFFISVAIERIALSMDRWTYTVNAPLVPLVKTSWLPTAQLIFLIPIIFLLTKFLIMGLVCREQNYFQ